MALGMEMLVMMLSFVWLLGIILLGSLILAFSLLWASGVLGGYLLGAHLSLLATFVVGWYVLQKVRRQLHL